MKRVILLFLLLAIPLLKLSSAETIVLSQASITMRTDSADELFTVYVDTNGVAAVGETIVYQVVPDTLLSQITYTGVSDTFGYDTVSITPGTGVVSGYIVVSLETDSTVVETMAISIIAGYPDDLQLSVDTTEVTAGSGDIFNFTCDVFDEYGNRVDTYTYSVYSNNKYYKSLTLVAGQGTFTVSTNVANDYTFYYQYDSVTLSNEVTVTVNPCTPVNLSVSIDTVYMKVGSSKSITVTIKDTYGNAVSGVKVDFSASNSGISFSYSTRYTNSVGRVTNTLLADTQVQETKITIAAAQYNLAYEKTIYIENLEEYYVTITPETEYVEPNQTVSLRVDIKDEYGNPIVGIPVYVGIIFDSTDTYGCIVSKSDSTYDTDTISGFVQVVYGITNSSGYISAYYIAPAATAVGDKDVIGVSVVTEDTVYSDIATYTVQVGELAKIGFLSDSITYAPMSQNLKLVLRLYDSNDNWINDINDSTVTLKVLSGTGYLKKSADTTVRSTEVKLATDSGQIVIYYETADKLEKATIEATLTTVDENLTASIDIYTITDSYLPTIASLVEFKSGDYVESRPYFKFVIEDTHTGVYVPGVKVYLNGTDITSSGDVSLYIPKTRAVYLAPSYPYSDSIAIVDYTAYDTPQQFVKMIYVEYKPQAALTDGEYQLIVKASDNTGNNYATIKYVFKVGNTFKISDIITCPNPFKSGVYFTYNLSNSDVEQIKIEIYDMNFNLIRTIEGTRNMGYNEVYFDGTDKNGNRIGNGLWLYRIYYKSGGTTKYTKFYKMVRNL